MHEFTQAQLRDIAAQSQTNVQTIWEMFGLPEPAPQINAGLVWAVMTAGLGGGWVQLPAPTDEAKEEAAANELDKFIYQATRRALVEAKEEGFFEVTTQSELLNDMYNAGFFRGKSVTEIKDGPSLVTMSAAVVETATNGDGAHEAVSEEAFSESSAPIATTETPPSTTQADAPPPPPAPAKDRGEERAAALRAILYDLKVMASGNIMPTEKYWDENKASNQPTAEMIVLRFDLTWAELATRADLVHAKRGRPPKQS